MPVEVRMPKLEMSQESAVIVEWCRQEGESIQKGEPLLVVETDKVTLDIESPASGVLAGIQAKAGDRVPVTQVIARLLQPGETLSSPQTNRILKISDISPLAQRIAESEGVNLAEVAGSGPHGKVMKADIQHALSQQQSAAGSKVRATPAARQAAASHQVNLDQISGSGPNRRIQEEDVHRFLEMKIQAPDQACEAAAYSAIPVSRVRRVTAERMVASHQQAPCFHLTIRVDMSHFEETRALLNNFLKAGCEDHISVTILLAKAVLWALARYPRVNSTIVGEEIRQWNHVHLGIATSTPEGLIVPVIHNAEQASLAQLSRQSQALIEKAREGTLAPGDLSGGTFTISNLGGYGVEQFQAILYPGQAAILAVGAIQSEILPVEGLPVMRPVLRLGLTVDHRILDGADAAAFLSTLRQALENPEILLL